MVNQQASRRIWLTFGLAAVLMLLGWISLAFFTPHSQPILAYDGKTLATALTDPRAQQRSYLFFLFLLGLTCLQLMRWHRVPAGQPKTDGFLDVGYPGPGVSGLFGLLLASGIAFLYLPNRPPHTLDVNFAGIYGGIVEMSSVFYLTTVVISCLLVLGISYLAASLGKRRLSVAPVVWLICIILAVLTTGLGLFEKISLELAPKGFIYFVQWHVASTFGDPNFFGDTGGKSGSFGYSYLFNLFNFALTPLIGSSLATAMRIVQIFNIAFVLLLVLSGWLIAPQRPSVSLLLVVLTIPWIHNNQQNFFLPNQSGWRFFGFPCTLIFLALAWHLERRLCNVLLGAAVVLLIAWNIETGIAEMACLMTAMALRLPDLKFSTLADLSLSFLGGIIIGILFLQVLHLLIVGHFINYNTLIAVLIDKVRYGEANGAAAYFTPLGVCILFFAVWNCLSWTLSERGRASDFQAYLSGSLSMLILVWGFYYVSRPNDWNLWSYLVPFGILLGGAVYTSESVRMDAKWYARPFSIPALAFALAVGPFTLAQTYQSLEVIGGGLTLLTSNLTAAGETVSGIQMPQSAAVPLLLRASYAKSLPPDTEVFTGDAYVLPKLAERLDLVRRPDPFFSSTTLTNFRAMIKDLRINGPLILAFDDPATLTVDEPALPSLSDKARLAFYSEMQAELAGVYSPAAHVSGWWIWRRK